MNLYIFLKKLINQAENGDNSKKSKEKIMELKNSKTLQNLANAFAGECQANARYVFISDKAKAEGYHEVGCALDAISKNELYHAKVFYNAIASCGVTPNVPVNGGYPFKEGGDLIADLGYAADNEYQESTSIYPGYADEADKEGFADIANRFRLAAKVEDCHMKLLNDLRKQLTDGSLYSRPSPVKWKCENCGHETTANEAPAVCPLCGSKQGYVKLILSDN